MDRAESREIPPTEVTIQEFQPEHYEGILHVYNTLFPEHSTTTEELRWDDDTWDLDKYVFKRYVALNSAGVVVGVGEYGHTPSSFHPRKFWMDIGVHPKWQRRGIGAILFDHVRRGLDKLEAVEVRAWAQEGRYDGSPFLQRRGFQEKRRTWESALDLSRFDFAEFSHYLEALGDVEITTWAEEHSRPEAERKLYELHTGLLRDVPRIGEYTPVSIEEFKEWNLGSPGHVDEAYFIAKDGEEYIGECVLERKKGLEGALHHGLTGVKREYRRRGIAMALKVTAFRWAREAGYATVRTWNDSANQAMLTINERFGFEKEPAWISFVKEMGEE